MRKRKAVPIIAPAVAQKAVRCIRKATAGIEGLAESDLALSVVLQAVSTDAEVSREVVVAVLQSLERLPQLCLCEEPEVEEIEVEETDTEKPPRRRRRATRAKKRGK